MTMFKSLFGKKAERKSEFEIMDDAEEDGKFSLEKVRRMLECSHQT